MDDRNTTPLNPLPPIVWVLALPIIAMEMVFGLGSSGLAGGMEGANWRLQAIERFAFSPDLIRMMIEHNEYSWEHLIRLVSYPLVHATTTHSIFALTILLALGKMTGEIFRWWAVVLVFFSAAIAGALAFSAVPWTHTPLMGAYPPVYGLIGSFTFLMWFGLAAAGENRYHAFSMIGFLLGVQLLFEVLFGGRSEWIADLAGFTVGFTLSFVVSPSGWAKIIAIIRQR